MQVLKFGGSSVANATNMSRVLDIVLPIAAKDRVVLVCSAISGCTDALIEIGKLAPGKDRDASITALRERHLAIIRRLFTGADRGPVTADADKVFALLSTADAATCVTCGELLSTTIITHKIAAEGVKVLWLDSRELIHTVGGKVDTAYSYAAISAKVAAAPYVSIFVAPGFIASDETGHPTDLGRGGSDYSAALYAAALDADSLQIWTDVPGIMTTNPKVVSHARTIPELSYGAALCMAEHGAKVLYAPTIAPAMEKGIAINIKDTFHPAHPGTMIKDLPAAEVCEWTGLANMPEAENERLCVVCQGPLDGVSGLERALAALKETGIVPVGEGAGADYIYVDVRPAVSRMACKALHREFFEYPALTSLDVYVAGHGAVGRALEALIAKGVAARSGKEIRLVEISSDHSFADRVIATAPRHSIFVDCTDSEDIHCKYVPLLEAGINIVSSNRRSLAVPYVEYAAMKQAALRNGCFLRYETTVGASLPMLETIARSAGTSDRITSIEAVVSCTLNYILSSGRPFQEALDKAKQIGLTEDDPTTDLGGKDALRKLLILAREAGVPLEEEDVEIVPVDVDSRFLPNDRFVASLVADDSVSLGYKASIRLRTVPETHPAYWLRGTDNAIIIRSDFHPSPLVIQGAGEGAQPAAASILNDILK